MVKVDRNSDINVRVALVKADREEDKTAIVIEECHEVIDQFKEMENKRRSFFADQGQSLVQSPKKRELSAPRKVVRPEREPALRNFRF